MLLQAPLLLWYFILPSPPPYFIGWHALQSPFFLLLSLAWSLLSFSSGVSFSLFFSFLWLIGLQTSLFLLLCLNSPFLFPSLAWGFLSFSSGVSFSLFSLSFACLARSLISFPLCLNYSFRFLSLPGLNFFVSLSFLQLHVLLPTY